MSNSFYKVIVAEDEDRIRNNLVNKINSTDSRFKVIAQAQTGKEALALVDQFHPDVLFTDIKMPVMDGLILSENIYYKYPYIKTIIVSGYAEFEFAQKAMRYNAIDYLLKPVDIESLSDVLNKILIILEADREHIRKQFNIPKGQHSPEEMVTMLQQYIKENFEDDINFNLIAGSFDYSPGYLTKCFTQNVGETPTQYLTNLRINKAKYLLQNYKKLSIKQIGEFVGYYDQGYFSRIFKKTTGKSPSEYR